MNQYLQTIDLFDRIRGKCCVVFARLAARIRTKYETYADRHLFDNLCISWDFNNSFAFSSNFIIKISYMDPCDPNATIGLRVTAP